MRKLRILWTTKAKLQLKQIHDYLKYEKKSPQEANNVKRDIIQACKKISYTEQYQKDDINPNYRRIIVRHYKLIYREENGFIMILRIFDTNQDPKKLLSGNE